MNPVGSVAVPPLHVTLTVTAPAACDGVVVLIVLVFGADTAVAAAPPKSTVHAESKFVPVNVTEVPPAVVPLEGETFVRVGGGGGGGAATCTDPFMNVPPGKLCSEQ